MRLRRIAAILFTLAAIGCEQKKETLFVVVSPDDSGVNFINTIEETEEVNILTYEYAYNGGGVAAGDFNNDGLCDLYFTGNTTGNKLFLNQGDLRFKDITQSAGVVGRPMWKTGVTVTDVNSDGWLDIYVCYSGPDAQQSLSNELFINSGTDKDGIPIFKEQAQMFGLDAAGTFSTQASFFDYDRDGDLDMFLINHGNHFYSPFINTNKLRNTRHPQFGNRLYRHDHKDSLASANGGHFFTEVSQEAGIHGGGLNFSLGVSVSDVNNDGWPDIFVTNDYEEQDFLYLNDQKGGFIESTKKSFGHLSRNGMGTDLADYNNDGRTDLIELDMWPEDNARQKLLRGPDDYQRYMLMLDSGFQHQQMRNTLQLNEGNFNETPVFAEIGQLAGVSATDWSWAPLFLDADNDGLKDIFITNGYLRDFTSMDFLKYTVEDAKKEAQAKGEKLKLYELVSKMSSTKTSDYIFRNNGDLTFSDQSMAWGIFKPNLSFGATYADLDNDGDLELITNNTNEPATIWKNNTTEQLQRNFITVRLKGSADNRFGIGARIYVETDSVKQSQELYTTRGFQSSTEPILHFGLNGAKKVNKLKVQWPDGKQTELTGLEEINKSIDIAYPGDGLQKVNEQIIVPRIFNDVSKQSGIDFRHHENAFVDFDREPLIPYQLSRTGPALATGDVNADGLDDFYIGGAAGQSGVLYIADNNGKFTAVKQPWDKDSASEDTGAVLFDVDNDKDLDLFVVSGGNEFAAGATEMDDRLYINTGRGKFIKAGVGVTPADHISGSCVTAGDYDKDGDVDLYVGGRGAPGVFPLPSPGAILRNDSNPKKEEIKLVVVTNDLNPDIRGAGMITDALWTDFNNDSWPDLILVGEWMPVRLFENKNGSFAEVKDKALSDASGLWNRIVQSDLDGDGDVDYVLGNAGTNLPWHASMSEPLTLCLDDFNGDGRQDPIICNYVQGKSFPVASRDEMILQMNTMRKKYVTYSAYGLATLEDMVGPEKAQAATRLQVNTLQSSVLENLGHGSFKLKPLPIDAQVSSVRGIVVDDFSGDGKKDILLSGNYFPFRTQYGPSDAAHGLLLVADGQGNYLHAGWESTGFFAPGDIRNMLVIKSKGGARIVAARNNDSVLVFDVGNSKLDK